MLVIVFITQAMACSLQRDWNKANMYLLIQVSTLKMSHQPILTMIMYMKYIIIKRSIGELDSMNFGFKISLYSLLIFAHLDNI